MARKIRSDDIYERESMKSHGRPTDEAELNGILRTAYGLAMKEQYAEALEICNWLIEDPATELAGLRERAAIYQRKKDVEAAISDLRIVIQKYPEEPADFYSLGILLLSSGETSSAVDAFSRAIQIGDERNFTYYRDGSLLFRAEAQLKLTSYKEALEDVGNLPPGFETYIPGSGMRSAESIAKEAKAGVERVQRNRFKMR